MISFIGRHLRSWNSVVRTLHTNNSKSDEINLHESLLYDVSKNYCGSAVNLHLKVKKTYLKDPYISALIMSPQLANCQVWRSTTSSTNKFRNGVQRWKAWKPNSSVNARCISYLRVSFSLWLVNANPLFRIDWMWWIDHTCLCSRKSFFSIRHDHWSNE